jgi:hypothetical protein
MSHTWFVTPAVIAGVTRSLTPYSALPMGHKNGRLTEDTHPPRGMEFKYRTKYGKKG